MSATFHLLTEILNAYGHALSWFILTITEENRDRNRANGDDIAQNENLKELKNV